MGSKKKELEKKQLKHKKMLETKKIMHELSTQKMPENYLTSLSSIQNMCQRQKKVKMES